MNLLFNPPLLIKIAKDYLSDMDRLTRYSFDKIDEYRNNAFRKLIQYAYTCLLYTSPSPRDGLLSRMPSSA